VARVADIDFFIATSEQEALILELNLIKQYHPRYNVRLKDDKTFPYLKICINEDWPRIYVTRRLEQDGGRYFGPFASAKSVRQTLRVLQGIFPFRICSRSITGTDSRACLEYHLGHCLAPCIGAVNQREYAEVINEVILFLEGKQEKVVRELKARMNKAAEAMDFEKAALIRDQIQAIHRVIEGQRIATVVSGEQDVIAFAQDKDQAYVQVFFVRNNKLIGRESFLLQGTQHEGPQQIMTSFIKQFYASSPYIPPLLLLQYPVEDALIIKDWLQSKRGARVEIQVPRRASKKQLIDIVAENARQGLEQLKIKGLDTPKALDVALLEIEKELAKKRQAAGGRNGRNIQLGLAPNDAKPSFTGKAAAAVAKKVGVSTRTFERGKKILQKASEEDKQQLREGKASISKVYDKIVAIEREADQTTQEDYEKLAVANATVNNERFEQNKLELSAILKKLSEKKLFCPSCGNTMFECNNCHKTLEESLKDKIKNSK